MAKLRLTILLLLATFALAADPNPADYAITVHVSASRIALAGNEIPFQELIVTIDGKKYELRCRNVNALLPVGDYKATLVRDEHKTVYDSSQSYEFLFPDKKTRKYDVVGQTE
jgi:hypothetical protein